LAFRIWLGRTAPEDVMAKAIVRHGGR
ncbi:MAG: hypothetical protein RJA59_1924, partial [Pseudomonadota bacterium]